MHDINYIHYFLLKYYNDHGRPNKDSIIYTEIRRFNYRIDHMVSDHESENHIYEKLKLDLVERYDTVKNLLQQSSSGWNKYLPTWLSYVKMPVEYSINPYCTQEQLIDLLSFYSKLFKFCNDKLKINLSCCKDLNDLDHSQFFSFPNKHELMDDFFNDLEYLGELSEDRGVNHKILSWGYKSEIDCDVQRPPAPSLVNHPYHNNSYNHHHRI